MTDLPTGAVTFLLTDVEGSTAAWERDPEAMGDAIAELDRDVNDVITRAGGIVVKQRGEGDSHFCVFDRPTDAASAALSLAQTLEQRPLSVRIAIHTGEAELRDGDYFGRTVNRAARLRSAANGGQVLVSAVTADLIADSLPSQASLRNLGIHRLKDLSGTESIWQLVHPDLTAVEMPLHTLDISRNNLPVQLTDIIGREEAVLEVQRLLAAHRLVTLVGLGGSGKTRLALQTAADVSDEFSGGVWLVEISPLNDQSDVATAILSAVGGPPGADPLDQAVEWIAERSVLVVLDNCEKFLDACVIASRHLLSRCPNLRILTTSRLPLDVPGEALYRVPALGLPRAGAPVDLDSMAESPAVRLFVERGRLVSPSFELDAQNFRAVAELCEGLDGMPLAIELAAARLKVLNPNQILARLGNRLTLVDGVRSADGGRTVRAAIEWSHDLLKPPERDLLRRLSIFEAAASLEAIEAVCAEWPGDPADALANLVDHSLVVVDSTATGRRYRLLDLVRAYALERLDEAGEREAMERARVRWVDDSIAQPRWGSPEVREELYGARADFVAALEWTELHDPAAFPGRVLRATRTWRYFHWLALADSWANRALEAEGLDLPIRMGLLEVAGHCAFNTGSYERALRYGEEQLAIARALGDARAVEVANNSVGASAMYLEEYDRARSCYRAALDSALGRPDGQSAATLYAQNLGLLSGLSGDRAGAVEWFEKSVELGQEVGGAAMGLRRLGEQAELEGEVRQAQALFERAVSAARAEGDRHDEYQARQALGYLAEAEHRWSDAAANHRAVRDLAVDVGDMPAAAAALLSLSRVARSEAEPAEARELMQRALLGLAGEPAQLVQILVSETRRAQRLKQPEAARDFARALLEVAQRDASATDVALALALLAQCEETLGNLEDAVALATRARPALAALETRQILRLKVADLLARCDSILATAAAGAGPL